MADTEFTAEILDQLLSGKILAPDEITQELVDDLRQIHAEGKETIEKLQECEKSMKNHQATLAQLDGAFRKTHSDLQKWWERALKKADKEITRPAVSKTEATPPN